MNDESVELLSRRALGVPMGTPTPVFADTDFRQWTDHLTGMEAACYANTAEGITVEVSPRSHAATAHYGVAYPARRYWYVQAQGRLRWAKSFPTFAEALLMARICQATPIFGNGS